MKIIVAAIQFDPKEGDIAFNLNKIDSLAKEAAVRGAHFAVLPEIVDIGYTPDQIKKLASEFPNNITKSLSKTAMKYKIALIAGLAEKRSDGLYNTAALFSKTGDMVAKYDKSHLCPIPPFNESATFKHGNSIFTTDLDGVMVGPTICYDCRFPEIYRKLALQGAELITISAAFPKSRIEHLILCSKTRALENQLFVITANHCGTDGGVLLGGSSMIINPEGTPLTVACESQEEVITAEINLDDIKRLRMERPIFTQRRPEIY